MPEAHGVSLDLCPPRLHRRLCCPLHVDIERRVDSKAARVDFGAEAVVQDLTHPLLEVGGDRGDATFRLTLGEGEVFPAPGLVQSQVLRPGHQVQNEVTTGFGSLRKTERVVTSRNVEDGGEQRGLRDIHIRRVLAEVPARGVLKAVAASHVDLVEISLENLFLRIGTFEVESDLDFLQLADVTALEADFVEHVTRELLSDGASATRIVECDDAHDGSRDADRVEASVFVEASVLRRYDGLGDVFRKGADGDGRPAFEAEFGNLPPVDREDLALLLVLEGADLGDRRAGVTRAQVLPTTPSSPQPQRSDENEAEEILLRLPILQQSDPEAAVGGPGRLGCRACHHGTDPWEGLHRVDASGVPRRSFAWKLAPAVGHPQALRPGPVGESTGLTVVRATAKLHLP